MCDNNFDIMDAHVACRQFGYLEAESYSPHYGRGSGPIWLDNLNCTGKEESLFDCPRGIGLSDCTHEDDVGVICQGMFNQLVCLISMKVPGPSP